jgi:hypothetical protein
MVTISTNLIDFFGISSMCYLSKSFGLIMRWLGVVAWCRWIGGTWCPSISLVFLLILRLPLGVVTTGGLDLMDFSLITWI